MTADHYVLDIDGPVGFSLRYERTEIGRAVRMFHTQVRRKAVAHVTLRRVSAWGDHIENVKHFSR